MQKFLQFQFVNTSLLQDCNLIIYQTCCLPFWFGPMDSVLNYSDTDGNINILPVLKRIVYNRIPVWVFRYESTVYIKFALVDNSNSSTYNDC